jgi:FAD:protein FMN transferase
MMRTYLAAYSRDRAPASSRSLARPGTLLLGFWAAALSPALAQERQEFAETHMAMPVRIVLYAAEAGIAADAARAAYARIAALEAVMSDFRPDSELRRLERRPGEWTPVGDELYAVLATALEVAGASDGAFDPTVGPLVALWRQARRDGRMPDSAALDAARRRTGWQKLELDPDRQAVRLAVPGMRLDLGGIAKGYILQQALATLIEHGVSSALLEAGGDIVVGAAPPGRAGWRIETPIADAEVAALAASLTHAAVATSGATAQFIELDGERYSHVVDPATGLGLTHPLVATVIAPDAALADALATALTVGGEGAAAGLLEKFPGTVASVRTAPSVIRRRSRRPRAGRPAGRGSG